MASVADDVAAVADSLGIDRFAVVGHSGGGCYALGAAATLGDRVRAVLTMAAIAPYDADGLDWFAGMVPSGVAALRAAVRGREAKTAYETSGIEYDPEFTAADLAMFDGPWSWLGKVVGPALDAGPFGQIDDDISFHGVATRPPSAFPSCLCTAPRTASFRPATASGSLSTFRTPSSGSPPRTRTSRSSARPNPAWSGCADMPELTAYPCHRWVPTI
jgi:hypothetical protein